MRCKILCDCIETAMLDRQIIESERRFRDALKKDRCRDVMRRQLNRLITLASKLQALHSYCATKLFFFPAQRPKVAGKTLFMTLFLNDYDCTIRGTKLADAGV
jgi:hypothetical protein